MVVRATTGVATGGALRAQCTARRCVTASGAPTIRTLRKSSRCSRRPVATTPHVHELQPLVGRVAVGGGVLAVEGIPEVAEARFVEAAAGDRDHQLGGLARVAQVGQRLDLHALRG